MIDDDDVGVGFASSIVVSPACRGGGVSEAGETSRTVRVAFGEPFERPLQDLGPEEPTFGEDDGDRVRIDVACEHGGLVAGGGSVVPAAMNADPACW